MDVPNELVAEARDVIDTNRYLTLGTTEADHRPRVSPVWFTHVGYRAFYWVSSPDAQHSKNITARSAVAIVIFDSTAPIGRGRAVYLTADAAVVADGDLQRRCAEAFTDVSPGAVRFGPEELSGNADLRLYRAQATRVEVHIRGGDPRYGVRIDSRREIEL